MALGWGELAHQHLGAVVSGLALPHRGAPSVGTQLPVSLARRLLLPVPLDSKTGVNLTADPLLERASREKVLRTRFLPGPMRVYCLLSSPGFVG